MSARDEIRDGPSIRCFIPAYQAAATLRDAVRSVLAQRGVGVTIVVVDHGSTDSTAAIAADLMNAFPQIRYLRVPRVADERRSASRPLNVALAAALAEPAPDWFYFRLDADDVLPGESVFADLLRAGGTARYIVGEALFRRHNSPAVEIYRLRDRARSRSALLAGAAYFVAHQGCLVHRDLLATVRTGSGAVYDESLGYGEDLDLTLRLLRAVPDAELTFAGIPAYVKRLGPGSITFDTGSVRIIADHARLALRYPRANTAHLVRYCAYAGAAAVQAAAGGLVHRLGRPSRSAEQVPVSLPAGAAIGAGAGDPTSS